MFGFYLKAAWRNAARTPLHSTLNLLGLSLGLAGFILAMLLCHEELTFNDSYTNHADLYLIRMGSETYGERAATTPAPANIVQMLNLDFPGIDGIARSSGERDDIVKGETIIPNVDVEIVDPGFIETIGVALLRGDPHSALESPDSIAIDRELAMTLFGTVDCLGQTLSINDRDLKRVTAVYAGLLLNQTYHSQALMSGVAEGSSLGQFDKLDSSHVLPSHYLGQFLLIRSPEVRQRIEAGLEDFGHRHYQYFIDGMKAYFILMPIDAWRLQGKKYGDQDSHPLIRFLAINAVGLLLLAVATLNYVNLATALATKRSGETGVRKAIGASRGQLVMQFLVESVALSFLATLLAMAMVELMVPVVSTLWYVNLTFDYAHSPKLVGLLAGFALIYGLLAGAYPALILSRRSPAEALRAAKQAEGTGRLRQILVLLQYAVSIGMIIVAGVMELQYSYVSYEIDGIDSKLVYEVMLPRVALHQEGVKEAFGSRMSSLTGALPGVASVSGLSTQNGGWSYRRPDGQAGGREKIEHTDVGPLFLQIWGIHPLSGRLFDNEHTDVSSIILNRSAMRVLGYASPEAALGEEVVAEMPDGSQASRRYTVIGVIPDFWVETIYGKIPPRAFVIAPASTFSEFTIKLTGQDVPGTVASIEAAYHEVVGRHAYLGGFIAHYLSFRYQDMLYDAETIGGFSLLAVFVAALGLFSLAEFSAERRTKEIGIRKAMGASSLQISALLVRDFLWPALAANLIAWPLAYLGMDWWLSGFAYRIDFPLWLLPTGSLLVLMVAGLTVLLHVVRVARAKPVTALRYE